jgi:hypothetical protein
VQRFRGMKTLQKFSSIHAQVHAVSIRSVISSTATFATKDGRPRWPSGALSPPNRRLGSGKLRNPQAACSYSDIARFHGSLLSLRSRRLVWKDTPSRPSTTSRGTPSD